MSTRLTECRDCKASVSREALTCPHCGCPWPDGKPTDYKAPPPITIDRLATGVCLGILLAAAFPGAIYAILYIVGSLRQ